MTALIALVCYVIWNIEWLVRHRFAPSLFLYFTGLPCPTTGATRSVTALCQGDLRTSLLCNPFTIPYVSLIAICAVLLSKKLLLRRRLVLPESLKWSWIVVLTIGWISKFVIGRRYW